MYLDHDERSKFAMGSFEQIIKQFQFSEDTFSSVGAIGRQRWHGRRVETYCLNFNHCVAELIWAVRPHKYVGDPTSDPIANPTTIDIRTGQDVPLQNLDFRGLSSAPSNPGMMFEGASASLGVEVDTIRSFELQFNGQARVQEREGAFFRLATPWMVHTNLPSRFLYVWSFAADPEDAMPTGCSPFSRIDNVSLKITLDPRATYVDGSEQGTATLHVLALNYNIVKYNSGLAALRFGA